MAQIGIFHGRGDKAEVFAQISVNFRNNIHAFNNGKNLNAFAIFMAIALHADQEGWAFPSRELLMKETGLRSFNTIASALRFLSKVRINGQRVLQVYRTRGYETKQWGHNMYLIFPDLPHQPHDLAIITELIPENYDEDEDEVDESIEEQPEAVFDPHSNDPYTGDSYTKNNHLKPEPILKEKEKIKKRKRKDETIFEKIMGEDEQGNPRAVVNQGALDALRANAERVKDDSYDYSNYHEDVRPIIRAFCETFNLVPPVQTQRGRDFFGEWESEAYQLRNLIHDMEIDAIFQAVRKQYDEYLQNPNKFGIWSIASPGSIIKVVSSIAQQMRDKRNRPQTKVMRTVFIGGEVKQIPMDY